MINQLLENLRYMNAGKVESGQATQSELETLIESERKRYENMTETQIKGMVMINF